MLSEVPVCKRCCLCLPLRYGLITWGYIRLAIGLLLLFNIAHGFHVTVRENTATQEATNRQIGNSIILGLLLLLTTADVILNVVFIIGGHKKNEKLLRTYYIYSFVLWVLLMLMGGAMTVYSIYLTSRYGLNPFSIWILFMDIANFLALIIIQAYVLLLVRSEIVKLKNNCDFKFVNHTADSECTVTSENVPSITMEEDEDEDCGKKPSFNYSPIQNN